MNNLLQKNIKLFILGITTVVLWHATWKVLDYYDENNPLQNTIYLYIFAAILQLFLIGEFVF